MRIIYLLALLMLLPLQSFAEVKIIEIKHRAATDLEPQIRELLDEGEKIQATGAHLVLIADGESLQAAVQLINLLDRQQMNLQISIRMSEEQQHVGQDTSAAVRYSNKNGIAGTGFSGFRRGNSSSQQVQTLQLVEGGRGLIEVGREIPFTEQWSAVTGDVTGYSEKTGYKTIATGFWVNPAKVLGNKVLVDVEPYISAENQSVGQRAPQVDYTQLRTRLQVPLGQWYPLGNQLMHRDKVSRAIISWRSYDGETDRQLQIRIDPVE